MNTVPIWTLVRIWKTSSFFLLISSYLAGNAWAVPKLQWDLPTRNSDNSVLTDLSGFKIKLLGKDGTMFFNVGVVSELALSNLPSGDYTATITSLDNNRNESGNSTPVAFRHLSEVVPSRAVAQDFNGDGLSDISIFSGRSFTGSLSTPSIVGGGSIYELYAGSTGSAAGLNDTDGDGVSEAILISRVGTELSWESSNPFTGSRRKLLNFGSYLDVPLTNCSRNSLFFPAVIKNPGSTSSSVSFSIDGVTKSISLPRGTLADVVCSHELNGNSRFFTTFRDSSGVFRVVAYDLSGQKVLTSPAIPATLNVGPRVFVLPSFETTAARYGVVSIRDGVLVGVISTDGKSFSSEKLPVSQFLISSLQTGVHGGAFRWLMFQTTQKAKVLAKFDSSGKLTAAGNPTALTSALKTAPTSKASSKTKTKPKPKARPRPKPKPKGKSKNPVTKSDRKR